MTVRQANRRSLRHAFTLLEILVVVAIIVVLAGVGAFYLLPRGEEAKIKIAKSNIEALTHQCEIYAVDHNNQPPQTLAALVNPGDGHAAYVQEKALKDPWGSVFQYDPSGAKNGGNRPDIWTVTPKGLTIGNWD
jgi:general secretion pathway protein G